MNIQTFEITASKIYDMASNMFAMLAEYLALRRLSILLPVASDATSKYVEQMNVIIRIHTSILTKQELND